MLLVLALGVGRSEVGGPASREASRTRGLGLGPGGGCCLGVGPQKWLYALYLEALGDCVALGPWERSGFLGNDCSQVASGHLAVGFGKWLFWEGLGGMNRPSKGRQGLSFKDVCTCVLERGTGQGNGVGNSVGRGERDLEKSEWQQR